MLCALAGVAVVVILGPCMLFTAIEMRTPDVRELVPIEGLATKCRETVNGAVFVLAGYDTPIRSAAGFSCADIFETSPQPAHVCVFTLPPGGASPLASFGLAINGKVVHRVESDLRAVRIDRAFRFGVGAIGTAALAWLFIIAACPGGISQLLTGESRGR